MGKNILRPNIQLFAEKDEPEKAASETQEQTETTQQEADNGLPKTQEELNALIEKRLARERKKMAKQSAAQPAVDPAAPQTGTVTPETGAAQPAAIGTENAVMQRELLSARAQLEAMRSGVRADVAEDAVMLAIHEVEKDGDDPDEDTIREALKNVLKRHPDWKQESKKQGGIKVGAQQGEQNKGSGKSAYSGVTFF